MYFEVGSLKSCRCLRTNCTHFTLTAGLVGNWCILIPRSFVGILATLLVWGASDAISTSSFLLFLTHILTIRHDKIESCPQNDVTHYCHVSFWPRDSNAIFEGKIAQLQAHVKSTIFILNISIFGIMYF